MRPFPLNNGISSPVFQELRTKFSFIILVNKEASISLIGLLSDFQNVIGIKSGPIAGENEAFFIAKTTISALTIILVLFENGILHIIEDVSVLGLYTELK